MSGTILSPEGNQIGAGNIQADVGGIININNAPDANDTELRRLWDFRKKQGMCVHCGNKTYKRKMRLGVVIGFQPLNIPGFVLRGVCIHPNCRPTERTNIELTTPGHDSDEDIGTETTTNEYDSIMSSVAEYHRDLKQQIEKVKKSSERSQAAHAAKLEEVIVQLNRSVEQAQRYAKEQLDSVRDELKTDVELAKSTLESHSIRLDRAEHGIAELKTCLSTFQNDVRQQMLEMQQKIDKLLLEKQSPLQNQASAAEIAQLKQEINALKRQLADQQSSSSLSPPPPTSPQPSLSTSPTPPPKLFKGPMKGHTRSVWCCTVFANGTRALSGSGNTWGLFNGSGDTTLRVWDLATGQTSTVLNGHTNAVYCCTVFANGTRALSGSGDKTLRVWDLPTGQTSAVLNGHTNWVTCCTVFANDTRALSGSGDKTLRVWDLATGQTSAVLNGHTNAVSCCTVFANGTRALSGSYDTTLRVWDLATGQTSAVLKGHTIWVNCCTVFANGTRALSGSFDTTLRVWDLATGQTSTVLNGHTSYVYCCIVFANDTRALSGSGDKTLRVWDLATGQTSAVLKGHTNIVFCCTVFANNTRALSGSGDNTLRVWDLDAEHGSVQLLLGNMLQRIWM